MKLNISFIKHYMYRNTFNHFGEEEMKLRENFVCTKCYTVRRLVLIVFLSLKEYINAIRIFFFHLKMCKVSFYLFY